MSDEQEPRPTSRDVEARLQIEEILDRRTIDRLAECYHEERQRRGEPPPTPEEIEIIHRWASRIVFEFEILRVVTEEGSGVTVIDGHAVVGRRIMERALANALTGPLITFQ